MMTTSRTLSRLAAAVVATGIWVVVLLAGSLPGQAQELKTRGAASQTASGVVDPFIVDLQDRTFRFFWETANPGNGLVPDRYPTPSYSSIAAVGFALTTYPIGIERGYVTRKEARKRVLTTLRFLRNAPQGNGVKGVIGYEGFF